MQVQLLKNAIGKKASDLIDIAIKDRDAGKFIVANGKIYSKGANGKCQMCIDGAVMRYACGLDFVRDYRGRSQPNYELMEYLGLDEHATPKKLMELLPKDHFTDSMEIYKAMYWANDNGTSWETIRDWLRSLGK